MSISNNARYLIKKIEIIADVLDLELSPADGRPIFNFYPGQYAMITYNKENGVRPDKHAFSLASSPTDKARLRFGIKIMGNFTQGLTKLKLGQEIFVSGPFGKFTFNEKKHRDLVLIAGGIGITPFLSAMKYAADKNLSNRLALIYSNKTLAGTLFFREIIELAARHENLRALFCLTDDQPHPEIKNIFNGRVNGQVIKNFAGSLSGKTFFICGPAPFMAAVKANLIALGVNKQRVVTEEFNMIPDAGFSAVLKNMSYAVSLTVLIMLLPLYLIFKSAQNPSHNKENSLFSIFSNDSTRYYDLAKKAYNELRLAKQASGQALGPANLSQTETALLSGKLPAAAEAQAAPAADNKPTAKAVLAVKIKAAAKAVNKIISSPKKDAPVQSAKVKSPNPNKVSPTPASALKATPAPTTQASPIFFEEEGGDTGSANAPQSTQPAANQPTALNPAPTPTTAASAPAPAPAPAQAPASNNPTAPAPAPTPTTAASAPAQAPASAPTASSNPTPASTSTTTPPAPAPSTSTSIPASETTPPPAPTPVPAPAPNPTPAPAPVTSASGVVSSPAPTPPPVISQPAPAPAPEPTRPSRRSRDNDRDDD